MADQIKMLKKNIEKMWPDIKKRLQGIGKDAIDLAKYSEKQIQKISQKSKLQIDIVSSQLKREQLYYKLGKETSVLMNKGAINNPKLKSINDQILKLSRKISSDKRGLKK